MTDTEKSLFKILKLKMMRKGLNDTEFCIYKRLSHKWIMSVQSNIKTKQKRSETNK